MKFALDSLQLISQYQVHKEGSVVIFPSWVIIDTYTVKDKRCNVCHRFFIVLSNGHHIVRALLSISKNRDGSLLQFGDIITINQCTIVVTKETYIIMIGDFYVKNSRANEPNGFPHWFTIMLIMLKIQSHSNPTIKNGSPSVLINHNSYPLKTGTEHYYR